MLEKTAKFIKLAAQAHHVNMKAMKHFLCILTAVFFIITAFESCRTASKTTNNNLLQNENLLVAYGKVLFNRSSCNNCHTLKIENESPQLISLDGIRGKYPHTWLYNYLFDPKSVVPHSKKTAFENLYKSPFKEEILLNIKKEKKLKIKISELWSHLSNQAQSFSEELSAQNIHTANNAEILALIAYIQRIPPSEKKTKLEWSAYDNYMIKRIPWEDVNLDSNNIIIKAANDGTNIAKGRSLYKVNCAHCHGQEGQGGVAPSLADDNWIYGDDAYSISRVIIIGNPIKGMISWKLQLTPKEVGEIISYITSLSKTNPENTKAPKVKNE